MGSRLEKNSEAVRKRIEAHSFEDEEGDEYESSKFGGFADYFRRKKIKLQNRDAELRSSSAGRPQIFRGIVAHVNGYTQPSLNDLHHLIVSHGGGFMQYLDGKTTVTHIIAANLTPKKAIEFRRYRVVKPAWVVDSVKASKLLPWDAYRLLDDGIGQRILGFDGGKIVNQENTQQRGYREQTNSGWYASQVKTAAKNIDDSGAQFPSTQAVAFHTCLENSRNSPKKSVEDPASKETRATEEYLDSSASFEATSSLEDALYQLPVGDGPEIHKATKPSFKNSPQDQDLPHQVATPAKSRVFENSEFECLDSRNPLKINEKPSPPKRSHEAENLSPSKRAKVMTAEEHNMLLLQDPKIRESSTANPGFLKQFYSESRLHHLSTWKAELKSRFQALAAEKSTSQKSPAKRKPGSRRYIIHVDFDCFFCAVSLQSAPEYVDKPAVVSHGTGTGSEIASCNYPARVFGVKNGMWMKQALKLCPDIKVLPYDFPAYEEASKQFYEAIIDVGGIVQSVSIDEALVDITSLCLHAGGSDGLGVQEGSIWREQEKADEIAHGLRKLIKERTGCAVSVGIGGNILLAKVALRKAKPAGQHQIKPDEVLEFVSELKVTDLPGVAYSIGGKLEEAGVKFVKDVRQLTKERLITLLGPKTGEKIWDYSRGIDRTEVGEQVVRKSVSAEVNWGIRFISQPESEEFVQNLCVELQRRLVEQKVKGRQLTMKIMKKAADAPLDPPKHLGHGMCDTYNKSITLGVATNSAEVTGREAVSILRSYNFSPGELRGLGVQMTKLEPLKPSDTLAEGGSQRKLHFGKPARQESEDSIDDPKTPKKLKNTPTVASTKRVEDPIDDSITPQKSKPFSARLLDSDDPIDEINSPKRAKATPVHPAAAIARANASDSSARKLNITGTQFILPTQIDPSILAQLPNDIRSKLIAQSKSKSTSRDQSPSLKSRSSSPHCKLAVHLPSQFDTDVFDALPEDMKTEILASYSNAPVIGPEAQPLPPQSPRKPKPLPPKRWTPTKKRGRPPGSKNKREDPDTAVNQSKLVYDPLASKRNDSPALDSDTEDMDPDFLSALPEDVRLELITEHNRKTLAKESCGAFGLVADKRKKQDQELVLTRMMKLPSREKRPTFTTRGLSSLAELRETAKEWVDEFRREGPQVEDVRALERYLRRVVLEEKDLGKARGLVKWIEWLVGEGEEGVGKRGWEKAVVRLKESVQMAVKERGLGRIDI